jgi:isochorismate synthase
MIEVGLLADVDLVRLGSRSGLLWRSGQVVLVGVGDPERVPLGLDDSTQLAQGVLEARRSVGTSLGPAVGSVGFAALPFDRRSAGELLMPPIVIAERNGSRYVTTTDGSSFTQVEQRVEMLLGEAEMAHPTRLRVELERSADEWRDGVVAVARDRISTGSLQKAVFARLLTVRTDVDLPLSQIVQSLASRFPRANVFAIDGFIGASPELLVSRSDRTVRAHPLAGTATRLADVDDDAQQVASLLASAKDRVEHRITIDWLLEELLPFCSYVDAEPEPSILTLANVHHLGTLVEGVLSEPAASVLDLVAAVHPTPAVGGDPQGQALALIDELEGFDRGKYAGPAGWVDAAGNGEFAVSVRTAQIDGPVATIAAGVGVVAQSDPEAELAETQAKFRAMLGSILPPQETSD